VWRNTDLAIYLSDDKIRTVVIEQRFTLLKTSRWKCWSALTFWARKNLHNDEQYWSCNQKLQQHQGTSNCTFLIANQVKKTILSEKTISISSRSYATVNVVKTSLSKNQDLLFKLKCQQEIHQYMLILLIIHYWQFKFRMTQICPSSYSEKPLKSCDRVWSWWVLFSQPERCWACSLNQGQLSKLSQNMLLWGVNCSHSVSSRNYRSTWMKNRPWSNGIWIKHHSGSSQSCHTLLPSSLKRLQQCDEGFWERVNEHLLIDDWEAKYKPEQAHVYSSVKMTEK
jgi:hypothetical protein